MTDVQDIFDKVIVYGRYAEGITTFMCTALSLCLRSDILDYAEVLIAKNEIDHYLGGYHTLGRALDDNDLPCKPKDRLAIYKDWANRPKLLKESPNE